MKSSSCQRVAMAMQRNGGSRRVTALACHQSQIASRFDSLCASAKSFTTSSMSMTLKPRPVIDWPGAERETIPPPRVVCHSLTAPASDAILIPHFSPSSSTKRRT